MSRPDDPILSPGDRVLQVLDEDPRQAEACFKGLRRELQRYMEWRGCRDPENLAQEVLVRGVRRISEGIDIFAANPRGYFFGIARLVVMEERKARKDEQIDVERWANEPSRSREHEGADARMILDKLLGCLSPRDRDLITDYHTEDRDALSRKLGITKEVLRVRVHRIRQRLEEFRVR
jgi:DNA-directed RNA polymerase specialized sigma24 family protein